MAKPMPDAWRELLEPKGISSKRALERASGVSMSAIDRLMHATGESSEDTISKVATTLGVSKQRVRALAGVPVGEEAPFRLPPEADRLNARQRRAVDELVRSMVERVAEPATGETPPQLIAATKTARKALDDAASEGTRTPKRATRNRGVSTQP